MHITVLRMLTWTEDFSVSWRCRWWWWRETRRPTHPHPYKFTFRLCRTDSNEKFAKRSITNAKVPDMYPFNGTWMCANKRMCAEQVFQNGIHRIESFWHFDYTKAFPIHQIWNEMHLMLDKRNKIDFVSTLQISLNAGTLFSCLFVSACENSHVVNLWKGSFHSIQNGIH